MKTSIIWGAAVLLCTPLSAQTFTSMKGFESTQGAGYCQLLGYYSDGRQQFVFGDYAGSGSVKLISNMQMRRSTRTNTNHGRSWSNLTIRMGHADFSALTDAWDDLLNSPTTVYSAKASFPGTTGGPTTTPAPWGHFAAKDDMTFPFSSTYLYLGKDSLTVDFVFAGGTFANGNTWGATTASAYYIDGYNTAGPNSWVAKTGTIRGKTTCYATGRSTASYFNTWMMSEYLPGGKAQHRWQWYGYNYPASAPVIAAVSVNGSATGTPFLASCQDVHIDLAKPFVLVPYAANAAGEVYSPFLRTPWVAAAVGASLWTQGAFDDGTPATLQLSRPAENVIAALPGSKPTNFGSGLYHPNSARPLGYGPIDYRIPILQFN